MLAGILANIEGSISVPNPLIYDFSRWSQDFQESLDISPQGIYSEFEWREWADYVQSTVTGLKYNLPNSLGFNSWQDWAQRVYQIVG